MIKVQLQTPALSRRKDYKLRLCLHTVGELAMYIPLAVHKNELVLIDSMDTFSHYFCLAKKQKMTPLAVGAKPVVDEEEADDEDKAFYGDGVMEIADDEDAL